MYAFLARLGQALLFPRRAAEDLCNGGRGGLNDVLWLLPLRLLIGEAALFLSSDLREMLLGMLSALSVDLLGIFLSGVLMALAVGRRERRLRPGLTTDLAALGWFGWLLVQGIAALIVVLVQRPPGPTLLHAIQVLGVLVFAVYWVIGFLAAQRAAALAEKTAADAVPVPVQPRPATTSAGIAGSLFIAALSALAVYDVVFIAHNRVVPESKNGAAPEVVVRQLSPATATSAEKLGEFRLSAQRGHPVLLDFWATWCAPCRASLPVLDEVHKRLSARGLRTIAINTGDEEAQVRAFAARLGLQLPLGLDGDDAASSYGVTTIPYLVLVGSDGTIKRVFRGVHSGEEIEGAVLSLGF
jgi:thiol-disulfide isomerase/thioredoxin